MEEIQMMIEEKIQLVEETRDAFMFEFIRPYVNSVFNVKIPKKLLERAIICFKMEHPAEFECLLNGDEGMKQKIVCSEEPGKIPEEMSTTKERCHEESVIESSPHAIERIKNEILEAKKEINNARY